MSHADWLQARTVPLLGGLIDASPTAIAVADATAPDLPLVFVNAAFERLTGYTAAEVLGRNCRFLQGPGTEPAHVEAMREAIAADRPTTVTVTNHRADGTAFCNRVTLSPVPDTAGTTVQWLGTLSDVTSEVEDRLRVEAAEARFRGIVETLPAVAYEWELRDGRPVLLYISPQVEALAGYPAADWLERSDFWRSRVHPDDIDRVLAAQRRRYYHGESYDMEYRVIRADNSALWVWDVDAPLQPGRGVLVDVTERHAIAERLRGSEALFRNVVTTLDEGLLVLGSDGRVIDANPSASRVLGLPADELVGTDGWWAALDARHADGSPITPLTSPGASVRAEGEGVRDIVMSITRPDGEQRWVTVNYQPMPPDSLLLSFRDVTVQRAAEQALLHQALHDPLTGLPNRQLLLDRLDLALKAAGRREQLVAVLFCDLDDFKAINDTLGHQAGDELLALLAPRLDALTRDADTLARFGGDEFVVLCPDIVDPEDARSVAERMLDVLREPLELPSSGTTHHITASIGIAVADPSQAADDVLRDADAAMYEAKARRDGHRIVSFDRELRHRLIGRVRMERDLRVALANDQLRLHYQPIVRIADETVVAVEALLRWDHPEQGAIPPAAFIPIAERSSLIVDIGSWVLDRAVQQLAQWREVGITDLGLRVNASGRQLTAADFAAEVAVALRRHGVPADDLALEITESVLMDVDGALTSLRALKDIGVGLLLDDFGTGYASLSYLQRFPLDGLKIDRSFVMGLEDEPASLSITSATLGLASALGLSVVAEGVETPAQLATLARFDCPFGQGYHWARPAPPDELASWLLARRAAAASAA